MLSPRWRKVLRDLSSNKARTVLVSLSIAVGIVGVGMISQTLEMMQRGMNDSHRSAEASAFSVTTLQPFDHRVMDKAAAVPGVSAVDGRASFELRAHPVRVEDGPVKAGDWRTIRLFALEDYNHIPMDKMLPVEGAWPPAQGELLMERTSVDYLRVSIGDKLEVELPDGTLRQLTLGGIVQDPLRETSSMTGISYGYLSMATLGELGRPEAFNTLSVKASDPKADSAKLERLAGDVRQAMTAEGLTPVSTRIPKPGKHWAEDIVQSFALILQTMGGLALALGACLVMNTIFGMLAGQLRQIGVMQVLGATRGSLFRLYLGTVLLYCLLASLLGIPLGMLGARAMASQSIRLLNFDSSGYGLTLPVLGLELIVGLLIPILAALYPLAAGTRITIREAIGGPAAGSGGSRGWLAAMLEAVKGLPGPLLLPIRNAFRSRARLTLTLATMSLGGAIVISVIAVQASMELTKANSLRYTHYDVQLSFPESRTASDLVAEAQTVTGVETAEAWTWKTANRVGADGSESKDLAFAGIPPGTALIEPVLLEGRWLQPGDRKAVVLDSFLLQDNPDLHAGSEITLAVNGRKDTWTVIGITRKVSGDVVSYAPFEALSEAAGEAGKAMTVQTVTKDHSREGQAQAAAALQTRFKEKGYGSASTLITDDLRKVQENRFQTVLAFLAVMSVLLVIVAALGLTGTMSLSVLERTREFGIMRSIGASDRSMLGLIIGEGLVLGLVSWAVGSLLAYPVSRQLSAAVGHSLFEQPLDYRFPLSGVLLWLAGSLIVAALASLLPAWKAARLEIRDVLAYE